MSFSVQTAGRQPRWPSAHVRATVEAEALVLEHDAAGDPDLIDTLALRFLMMFEPARPPSKVDLLVVDVLRQHAEKIRSRRKC